MINGQSISTERLSFINVAVPDGGLIHVRPGLAGVAMTNLLLHWPMAGRREFSFSTGRCGWATLITFMLFLSVCPLPAQTNVPVAPDDPTNTRLLDGHPSDITSAPWLFINLPEDSTLLNENQIAFTGTSQPVDAIFSVPLAKRAPERVVIHNFPFKVKDFIRRSPQSSLKTRWQLRLRVYPLETKTNWTETGEMKITPARSVYDYGLPVGPGNRAAAPK